MGEKAKLIGEKLENFGKDLFSKFGWRELLRDKEIQCVKFQHKNKEDKNKRTHGIDFLHICEDPYNGKNIGIITECKNRTWSNINKSNLNTWLKELINAIECSLSSKELREIDLHGATINTGILLVHCNDDLFDENKFYSYLQELECPNKRNPLNILIAGNDRIERWTALFEFINSECNDNFKFVYPCIEKSIRKVDRCLSVNHLFSKFIFGTYECHEERKTSEYAKISSQIAIKKNIVFSFDDLNMDSFRYLFSLFKYFQFEDADKYSFVFYPKSKEDIEYTVKNFKLAIKDEYGKMVLDENKIQFEFMKNRHISSVNYHYEGRVE
jgi:hypothetical protein